MRPSNPSLLLFFVIYCTAAFAQTSSTTPLLNRIDRADGAEYNYHSQSGPIVGDFNNDGNTDFLTLTSTPAGSPVLQVALGRGDGTIVSAVQTAVPQSMTIWTSGMNGSFGAAVADFNGDSKPDAVLLASTVNGATSSYFLSYFAGKGDGTFSVPSNVALPNGEIPTEIASADFNHGGKSDVAVLCQGGDLLIYLGRGDGTFQNPVISSTGAPQNSSWMHFLIGDINKDGFPDLLLYSFNNDYVAYSTSIMQGNGDGSFKSPVVISQLPNNSNNQQWNDDYQQFILTDLNGDGNLDILADLNSGSQILFLAGDGKGGFASALTSVTLPAGFQDQSASSPPALVDLNGDGKLDLVFSLSIYGQGLSQTLWAKGNRDGTFQTPSVLTTDDLWGVYAVSLSSKTVGLFAPTAENQSGSQQAPSVLYLPTKGSQAIEVDHAVVNFGPVNLGSAISGGRVCGDIGNGDAICPPYVQVTNRGTVSLDLSLIATQAPFAQLNDCSTSLPVGQSCEISAEFASQQTGFQTAALAINNGTSMSPLQVALIGTGVTPTLSLSPASLTFSPQKVGTTGSPQTFTLTNLAGAPQNVNIRMVSQYETYFVENDDCGYAITTSCTISIQFAPLSVGQITATLEVWTNEGNLITGTMSGTAYSTGPAISISPSSLDFGTPFIGTNVTPQSVTLTNTGDAPALVTSVTSGTGFTALNACGSSIQPGASCVVGVFVDTSATGTKTGSLTITDNAPNNPQTVALTGNVQSLSVAASPGSSTSATISSGGTATYSLTITPVSGFTGAIAAGCKDVPAGFSCTPSSPTVTSDGKNPVSVTYTVRSTSSAAVEPGSKRLGTLPTVLSFSVLILLLPKSIRDRCRWLVMLVLLALTVPLAIGCAGGSVSKSTPGTPTSQNYTLTATFAAAKGGSVQLPLKLTVQN